MAAARVKLIKIDDRTFGTIRQRELPPYRYPTLVDADYSESLMRFTTGGQLIALAKLFGWVKPRHSAADVPACLDNVIAYLDVSVGKTAEAGDAFALACGDRGCGVENLNCPDCGRFFGLAHKDQNTKPQFDDCLNTDPTYVTARCPMRQRLAVVPEPPVARPLPPADPSHSQEGTQ